MFPITETSPNQQIVTAVREWLSLSNAEEVHKFLGLVSHYHSYIHEFADIVKPLHNLTQKQLVQFNWSDQCETTLILSCLKRNLYKLLYWPIYPPFDKSPPFVLRTDGSSMGIGTILDQGDMHMLLDMQAGH